MITTLRTSKDLPTDPEITKMAIDPKAWLNDYKEGVNFRQPEDTFNNGAGVTFDQGTCCNAPYQSSLATKVYMFGDNANVGSGDTNPYIKNRVYPGNPASKMYLNNISGTASQILKCQASRVRGDFKPPEKNILNLYFSFISKPSKYYS